MSQDRNNPGAGKHAGTDRAAPTDESSKAGNRDGAPGKDEQQDVRTADEEHDRRPKDDPSRAPESGTP